MTSVSVFVRCRPILPSEVHLQRTKVECNEIDLTVRIQSAASQNTDKVFKFNQVLPETSNQDDVFEHCSPMIDSALGGLHSTIFAYGSTGSGKTYTVEGLDYVVTETSTFAPSSQQATIRQTIKPDLATPKERHGILLRVMEAIFERARERTEASIQELGEDSKLQFRIRFSCTQLYSEKLTDLITKRTDLKLRWTSHGTFAVDGLSRSQVETPEQARELFFMAARNKIMGSHNMNQQSSRSHCIYTFYIDQWSADTPENVIRSELAIVDLAGSEKLNQLSENPSAQLLKESIDINTSLLALGKVITALALRSEGKLTNAQLQHVPYRESKLTKLLQHALGGNAVACMIACITPLDSYVDESMSTLMYASRARHIKNDPRVNEDPRAALIRQLREENTLLKAELTQYRQYVLDGNENNFDVANNNLARSNNNDGSSKKLSKRQTALALLDNDENSNNNNELPSSPSKSTQGLAEKLLSSCAMLKDVIGVNAKLREAFDNMHMLKKKAERHEAELEAENLGLRERIELLESIALKDANNDYNNNNTDSEVESSHNGRSNNNNVVTMRNGRNVVASASNNYNEDLEYDPYYRVGGNVNNNSDSPVKRNPMMMNRNQQQSTLQYGGANSAPSSATKMRDGTFLPEMPSTPTSYSSKQQQNSNNTNNRGFNFGGALPRNNNSSSRPSSQDGRNSTPMMMTPNKPNANNNNNFYGGSFASFGGTNNKPQQQQQSQQQKSQKQQLKEYAQKYKNRAPGEWMDSASYSTYYQIAKKKQQERAPDVDRTIRELSKRLPQETLTLLPSSAQKTSEFGTLAFGGTNVASGEAGSVQDLEEKRRQRQLRLQQLQERHKMLQQGGSGAAALMQEQQQVQQQLQIQQPQQQKPMSNSNNTPLYPSTSSNSYNANTSGVVYSQQQLPVAIPRSLYQQYQERSNNNNVSTPTKQQQQISSGLSPVIPPRGNANTNFQYLNQNELRNTFSDEQLAILKQRASALSPKQQQQQQESSSGNNNNSMVGTRGSAMRM